MPNLSRQEFLRSHPTARAWASLAAATTQTTNDILKRDIPQDALNGKKAVIIGSGVAGLTTAYELLSNNTDISVTVLEARHKTGGRCLSLRSGDTLQEDVDAVLRSDPGEIQHVCFDRPDGDDEPYLNAGPGRIPSSHKLLLNYLRRFQVDLEVYVMNSMSNLVQMNAGPGGSDHPVVYRRLIHNTRGHLAAKVFNNAAGLLGEGATTEAVTQLQSLMVTFGDLTANGEYIVGVSNPGEDENEYASDRAGFTEVPGVGPGVISEDFTMEELLASEFWKKTSMYQPVDYLWQPTLFQPVGGMDSIPNAFVKQIENLISENAGKEGEIRTSSVVTCVDYDESSAQYTVTIESGDKFQADYLFSNAAIPFLQKILSPKFMESTGFNEGFRNALDAVYTAQCNSQPLDRFLAYTSKVGWQGDRFLWQGSSIGESTRDGKPCKKSFAIDDSQVGVVPIFGGISWTDHSVTQIWYPSSGYYDKKGILTGAYNFSENAQNYGLHDVEWRLNEARAGAKKFDERFGLGLDNGVAIAWQNMAHIKGGWAQWFNVDDSVNHYNKIKRGTGVNGADRSFFIVGDQVSSLPGWQEGAVASAINAFMLASDPTYEVLDCASIPDTRLMVEGV